MFKLIWGAVVGGGPAEWAILGLGAVLALGGSFAGGALWEANKSVTSIATVASNAGGIAAKAQKDADVKAHDNAVNANVPIKAANTAHDNRVEVIYHNIITKEQVPAKNCDLQPDVIKLLNEAGHF